MILCYNVIYSMLLKVTHGLMNTSNYMINRRGHDRLIIHVYTYIS